MADAVMRIIARFNHPQTGTPMETNCSPLGLKHLLEDLESDGFKGEIKLEIR